jgi:aminoglycoside 3-N-acetyltransferase
MMPSVTLLHYAESLADVPGKRTFRYRQPSLVDGRRTWVEVEEYDTNRGVMRDFDDDNDFVSIVEEYLATGHGRAGLVGAAKSYLFDAQDLVTFGVAWMERAFGMPSEIR